MDIPAAANTISQEATRFKSAVSESILQRLGGTLNYLLKLGPAVGSVELSVLDPVDFLALKGSSWVLMDGQSCVGSKYADATGLSNVPDWRNRVPRMAGTLAGATRTLQDDAVGPHTHAHDPTANDFSGFFDINPAPSNAAGGALNVKVEYVDSDSGFGDTHNQYRFKPTGVRVLANDSTGSAAETRVKAGIANFFIRIN